MSEFAAAYGLAAFDNLQNILNQNRFVYQSYFELFKHFPEIRFLSIIPKNLSNFHYIVAQVPACYRDSLVEHFHKNNVFVRKYFFPRMSSIRTLLQ